MERRVRRYASAPRTAARRGAASSSAEHGECELANDFDRRDERVAGAALGTDELDRTICRCQLPAQTPDLHIDRTVVDLVVVQPRQGEQLVARKHVLRGRQEYR